jgi:hypothetical protein
MSKKNIGMIALLVVLGVIYVFKFTGAFQERNIQIVSQVRPKIGRGKKGIENAITFTLDNKYGLTSVKVIEGNDFKTNKYPHALWHLISETNSEPTKLIIYGVTIDGMKPKIEKLKPEALKPNASYVLLLEAGKLQGQITFQAR